MKNDKSKTQITNSHRLIKFIEHLTDKPTKIPDATIDVGYFFNNIINQLELNLNFIISNRQSCIIKKVKSKNKKPTNIDILTESFYDPYFFRNSKRYIDYEVLKNKIIQSMSIYNNIEIILPLFSRKPISPIKNRGHYADIGEIATILKIASFVKVLQSFSNKQIFFTILADGKKYNRACNTLDFVVEEYQKSLQFWIDYFKLNDLVRIEDYEKRVFKSIGEELYLLREEKFYKKYHEISVCFDKMFDSYNIKLSLLTIREYPLGEQIFYTFYSIISSVNYSINLDYYTYINFIYSLHTNIKDCSFQNMFSSLREEAWIAAKKYVAISLVDRELKILNKINPNCIKFTIHAKQDELRFIDSTTQNFNITAQHCVGGIESHNHTLQATFDYRIFREAKNEQAICLSRLDNNRANIQIYGYLVNMSEINQPIYYRRA